MRHEKVQKKERANDFQLLDEKKRETLVENHLPFIYSSQSVFIISLIRQKQVPKKKYENVLGLFDWPKKKKKKLKPSHENENEITKRKSEQLAK